MIPQCRVRRPTVQHVLHFCFLSDRVPAGRVHGPGSQVRARPGGEVLQIRSSQVESDQAADERDGVVPDKRLHYRDKEQDTLRRGPHPDRLPRTDGDEDCEDQQGCVRPGEDSSLLPPGALLLLQECTWAGVQYGTTPGVSAELPEDELLQQLRPVCLDRRFCPVPDPSLSQLHWQWDGRHVSSDSSLSVTTADSSSFSVFLLKL